MPMSPRLLRPIASGVHPEAAAWRSAVVANGGSVSASTMKAVSTFCAAIDAAGLRDRFYRLNLFCGNSDASLAAVRTPLYRGPSRTGTQYGNALDTNNNFVSGDYAETGTAAGLKGNGSNKWLNTGLDTQFAGDNDFSVSCYVTEEETVAFRHYIFAAQTLNNNYTGIYLRDGAVRGVDSSTAFYPTAPTGISGNGMHTLSRVASNDVRQFYNSTAGPVATTQTAASRGDKVFFVFANNNATNTTAFGISNARLASYHIGLGMTVSQQAAFYAAMQAFQTTLGRQV